MESLVDIKLNKDFSPVYVTERHRRSLYKRLLSKAPCSYVHLAYSLRQPHVVYYLLTPSTLTIDRATSCRLLEYIYFIATARVL